MCSNCQLPSATNHLRPANISRIGETWVLTYGWYSYTLHYCSFLSVYLNGYIIYLFLFSRERSMIRCHMTHICSKATRCNKFITYDFRKICTILMMIFVIFVVISCHSGVKATGTLRLRLEVYKGMEWNGFSRERNGMEWNLKILFGSYKKKEWNGMESK